MSCIISGGSKLKDGYGRKWKYGKRWLAHRLAYFEAYGSIPDGVCVCHRCDNPPCINLDHLFLASHSENMIDKKLKGRSFKPKGLKNGRAKLTPVMVQNLKLIAKHRVLSWNDMGKMFGINKSHAMEVANGQWWRA